MSIAFDGLSSGLDTNNIIEQLITLEARPIRRYENRIDRAEELQGAYRDLNNRVSNLHSRTEILSDSRTFEPMDATSSDPEILRASIADETRATAGTYDIFVESLASRARVRSGAFLQNQKMATDSGETMHSDFRITGGAGSTLNLSSPDFLDQLNYNVQTTGEGNEDFFVRQDTAEGTVGVSIDLDAVENFNELMELINDPTIGPGDHDAVLEYEGAGEDRSTLADPENWSMNLQYHSDSDRFTMHATESHPAADGGRTVELADATAGEGFFQRIGFAADQYIHTFDQTQADYGQNLLSIDAGTALEAAAFQSPVEEEGTIRVNNTEIQWDAADDTLEDVIDRINEMTPGVNASYNTATDRVTLENRDTGGGDIVVEDLTGNLANVLNLREPGEETTYQSAGNYREGEEAEVLVDGDLVTSSDNTVTFSGLQLELLELYTEEENQDDPLEVEIFNDNEAIVEEVGRFVDQYNSVIEFINQRSVVDVSSAPSGEEDDRDSGVFVGASLPRDLQTRLARMLTDRYVEPGTSDIYTVADLGIEQVNPREASTRDRGKLEFNQETLREQLEDNPDLVRDFFVSSTEEGDSEDGLATTLESYLAGMVDTHNGIIANRIEGFDSRISNLQNRIERYEGRLENRRSILRRQFMQMESMMAHLHQQQDSLMMSMGMFW